MGSRLKHLGHFFGFAFFTADFLASFFALLLESPAVCYAIRYGKARPLLHPRYGPCP